MPRRLLVAPLIATALAAVAAGCASDSDERTLAQVEELAKVSRGFSARSLERVRAEMDPAMLALASRHDPTPAKDFWGRTEGWEVLDIKALPTLGFGTLTFEDARRINALKPAGPDAPAPAKPFVLRGSAADRREALHCLTLAVYYEAAREPLAGQRAVAQTVLNRVRHPEYPKTVCGVVFEGSQRVTGCQFSFTCDGSMAWAPEPDLWRRAQKVAKAALGGYVAKEVGTATHYHADYVAPYWAPTLYKLVKVGAHIFYRWTGPAGEPAAFVGRYRGGEKNLTLAVLRAIDERTQGEGLVPGAGETKVTLASADGKRTYAVRDLATPGATPLDRTNPALTPSRRQPSKAEVEAINARLAELEKKLPQPASPPPDPAPGAD